MISMGLAKFAMISQFSAERRAKEYEKYLKKGGYRYYRTFRQALDLYAFGAAPKSSADAIIGTLKPGAEKTNNQRAFDHVAFWLPGKGALVRMAPSEIVSPGGQLRLLLTPEFALSVGRLTKVVTVWNYKSPRINDKCAAIIAAGYLHASGKPPVHDIEYGTLDSHSLDYLAAGAVAPAMRAAFVAELAFADAILSDTSAGSAVAV